MGAGILLRAVQEPVFMQQNPPFASDLPATVLGLEFTFYQWGLTAWAFYGVFALVMGNALFVQKKPMRVSSTTELLVSHQVAKNGVDIIAIITTLFGLIAAIALGTTQINGGLTHLLESHSGISTTVFLAIGISLLAGISAWNGINRGIKLVSQFNIIITLGLLVFVFVSSDMIAILHSFVTATTRYLIDFVPMSLALSSHDPGIDFLTDWTFYYWAFWIAWAPFTGIFIARISKGRSLRQLLLGVLIIPSLGTFFWFSVFGTSAFQMIENWGSYNDEFANVFTSIFIFLENYPLASLLNFTTILLLIGFLVTSVDSAVFVLSMFTDNGNPNPSKRHRVIWSMLILVATLALILLGNIKPEIDVLQAIQKLLIITSLPFTFLMPVMVYTFFYSRLRAEPSSP
jgi:glycine betaine transporter